MLDTVRTLDGAKLDPTTLVLREPTLDDVFLELTGHVAEAPTTETATRPCPPDGGDERRPNDQCDRAGRRHCRDRAEGRPPASDR